MTAPEPLDMAASDPPDRSFRDRETQREARSGAVVAWIVAAALVVAVVWWVLR